jgi:hypothetical protein
MFVSYVVDFELTSQLSHDVSHSYPEENGVNFVGHIIVRPLEIPVTRAIWMSYSSVRSAKINVARSLDEVRP